LFDSPLMGFTFFLQKITARALRAEGRSERVHEMGKGFGLVTLFRFNLFCTGPLIFRDFPSRFSIVVRVSCVFFSGSHDRRSFSAEAILALIGK
jgi:hypothetical protein